MRYRAIGSAPFMGIAMALHAVHFREHIQVFSVLSVTGIAGADGCGLRIHRFEAVVVMIVPYLDAQATESPVKRAQRSLRSTQVIPPPRFAPVRGRNMAQGRAALAGECNVAP